MKQEKKKLKFNDKKTWKEDFKINKVIYLLFIPVFAYFFIFNYIPMFGILFAFQNYNPIKGVFGSQWIGWQNFADLFSGEQFGVVMRNTSAMALMNLTLGFVAPIIFAFLLIMLQRYVKFQRASQLLSYLPHFVSM